jgi:coatomer subunit beta'
MYILGYIIERRTCVLDRQGYENSHHALPLSMIEYETAIIRADLHLLITSSLRCGRSTFTPFFWKRRMREQALDISTDPDKKRFELAVGLGKTDIAYSGI